MKLKMYFKRLSLNVNQINDSCMHRYWNWVKFESPLERLISTYDVMHNMWKCFILIGWLVYAIFEQFMLFLVTGDYA